jgi:ABC-type branched-subunit amino acid transport system ATPase component
MGPSFAIVVADLSKDFGKLKALGNISFTVRR